MLWEQKVEGSNPFIQTTFGEFMNGPGPTDVGISLATKFFGFDSHSVHLDWKLENVEKSINRENWKNVQIPKVTSGPSKTRYK